MYGGSSYGSTEYGGRSPGNITLLGHIVAELTLRLNIAKLAVMHAVAPILLRVHARSFTLIQADEENSMELNDESFIIKLNQL